MSKAFLLFDKMPDNCRQCILTTTVEWLGWVCVPKSAQFNQKILDKYFDEGRPSWCPLQELPDTPVKKILPKWPEV